MSALGLFLVFIVVWERHFETSWGQALIWRPSVEALKKEFPVLLNDACRTFLGLTEELTSKGEPCRSRSVSQASFGHLCSARTQLLALRVLAEPRVASVVTGLALSVGVEESLPPEKTKQKRESARRNIYFYQWWDGAALVSLLCVSRMGLLISVLLRSNSYTSNMCNTTFCASSVAELPFLQGADFFSTKLYRLSRIFMWLLETCCRVFPTCYSVLFSSPISR